METGNSLLIDEGPLVRRLIAPNPGPYTGPGTNTYLVGAGAHLAVIDPGPDMPEHIERVLEAAEEAHAFIDLILVTHSHADHLPGARLLRDRTGADLIGDPRVPGVNRALSHGQRVPLSGCSVEALYTPGHLYDHYCFLSDEGSLFAGDLIAGFGTVVVSPPDGDMDDYLASLRLLQNYPIRTILPGHWPRVDDPAAKIAEYIEHRMERERHVLDALQHGDDTPTRMVERIYPDLDPRLLRAAAASVTAHLISLERRGLVRVVDRVGGRLYQLIGQDG